LEKTKVIKTLSELRFTMTRKPITEILNAYDKDGYIYEYILYNDGSTGLVMQHRRIWEENNGQSLPKGFEVHHRDHDRKNNLASNLLAIEKVLHTIFFHNINGNLMPEGVWC
jgi:negative regulator of sigma E activity